LDARGFSVKGDLPPRAILVTSMAGPPRIVLHVDMDAFYASIEQRDDPALAGRPVIVGGPRRRGVVSTASYEARPFGVHSAMPMSQALRLCPDAVVRAPRMGAYAEVSREIMAVLAGFSPLVEPLSLDEAFLDMTGCERLFGPPDRMARSIKDAIRERTELTASVGIGGNKFLAKLASDLDKPDGLTWVPFGTPAEFIAPLPVRRLWGVGPRVAERLAGLGLETIGQVARADRALLERELGASLAAHLQALADARDDRPVEADHDRRSIGAEVTLAHDIRGRVDVERVLRRQCERAARGLRSEGLVARAVRVKLRLSRGFRLVSRQGALPVGCDDSASLFVAASGLLDRFDLDDPIRLVGVAAFALEDRASPRQLELFGESRAEERSRLEHAVDDIRERFGDKIGFGAPSGQGDGQAIDPPAGADGASRRERAPRRGR
jgi:DNA polymerase-4